MEGEITAETEPGTEPEVSEWLRQRGGDLLALEAEYSILSAVHEGLILLCYEPQSPQIPLVNDCRGLVLSAADCAPVGWPMDRFFDVVERTDVVLAEPLRVEEKIDGSYIILLFDGQRWVACTRHTFCAIDAPYQALILAASGCSGLDALALQAGLDESVTWCLELCSPQTRIIQPHPAPVLYLLAGVGTRSRLAVSDDDLDAIAAQAGFFRRPLIFSECHTRADVDALIARKVEEDLLFEGVVMVGADGERLKVKSPHYRMLGRLKYRGWRIATPKLLAPIIRSGQAATLLAVLAELRDDTDQLAALVDRFEATVGAEVERQHAAWTAMVAQPRRDLAAHLRQTRSVTDRILLSRWEVIGAAPPGPDARAQLRRWILEGSGLLSRLFGACWAGPGAVVRQYADDPLPPPESLLVGSGVAERHPVAVGEGWRVWCACGLEMTLKRMKVERLFWRTDRSGHRVAIQRYAAGCLLWICTCGCDHEAHQRDRFFPDEGKQTHRGEPLGIPASQPCKQLRLLVHDHLRLLRRDREWSRDEVYQWMSVELGLPRAGAHVALFDGPRCLDLIARITAALPQSSPDHR
ncbi:MAG: hypothetical protein ACI8RZ_007576 [Myxococcota bacterium]|jgi:hypothetical protein